MWSCTHLMHPTDEQLRFLDISSSDNNLPSVLFEYYFIGLFPRAFLESSYDNENKAKTRKIIN